MSIRQALKNGEVKIGSWVQIGSPVSGEILAKAGFDWLAADMEHTEIELSEFANRARAISNYPVSPMVRVCENNTIAIRKCLDCGAQGIIVPLVSSKADVEKAVQACKFPPQGIRGYAFVQANEWGKSFDAYAQRANEDITVIVMIETKAGVDNIEEILSVPGVDGVFIGPYDLSGSYGVAGQTSHPLVTQAKENILKACQKFHKAAGQHIVLPTKENINEAIAQGYQFIALGMDTVFVQSGAEQSLQMAKEALQ